MEANCTYLPYSRTNLFSDIVIDYINGEQGLRPFYKHPVSNEGILKAIKERQKFALQRNVLVEELQDQYKETAQFLKVQENTLLLLRENTFTITTAHQPNIFTGPLYFIYKILHVIRIAEELTRQLTDYNFVPVYFMGSEDADLEELGSITVDGVAYTWQTQQTGAVGRMKVDKALVELMRGMQGQLGVLPYGKEIIKMFEEAYSPGKTIQMATFDLVNRLFGEYGLIVLIPDNANLKKLFQPVVERELTERFSSRMLKETIAELEKQYKPQAEGRELNLFYLIDDARERIVITDSKFQVPGLRLEWSLDEILEELNNHPERFSPNVILRGTLQETILPNIAFVGGGGELAYWLELKDVFESAHIPYPMLLLRNSFLILENKYKQMIRQLGLQPEDLFESEHELMKKIVTRNTENKVRLNGELQKVEELYDEIMGLASNVDATLKEHVAALKTKAVYRLQELEKKMIRAEKRKYGNELLQLQKIKRALFPHNSLQERVENIAAFYGKYGKEFIGAVEQCSRTLQQEFAILEI